MGYVGREQDESAGDRTYVSDTPGRIDVQSLHFYGSKDQAAATQVFARRLRRADVVDTGQPASGVNVRNLAAIARINDRPGIEPSPLGPSFNKRMIELFG